MKKSKIFILICTLSILIILCVISAQPLPKQKNKVVPPPEKQLNPLNIIYILADDLGYADITSTGTKYLNESYRIYTENIDQLLTKNSISMDNFYVQPVCSPTRAALMTGRYPHRVGIPFAFAGTSLIKLPTNIPTLPKALKERNYKTHLIGKWHLGASKKSAHPLSNGFDSFFGNKGAQIDQYSHIAFDTDFVYDVENKNGEPAKNTIGEYYTDLLIKESIETIEKHVKTSPKQPFYLQLSHAAVHDPLPISPKKYMDKCKNIDQYKHYDRYRYCGLVQGVDASVGEITKLLKKLNIDKSTLIIFSSDNGGVLNSGALNVPYAAGKGGPYEGGVRSIGYIKGLKEIFSQNNRLRKKGCPKVFDAKRTSSYDGKFHIVDVFQTLLEIVDVYYDFKDAPTFKESTMDSISQYKAICQNGIAPPRTSVLLAHKPLNDYCYPSKDKICKPMDQYPIAESSYLDGDWKVIIGVSQYNLINDRPDPFLLEWLCVKGLENLPWARTEDNFVINGLCGAALYYMPSLPIGLNLASNLGSMRKSKSCEIFNLKNDPGEQDPINCECLWNNAHTKEMYETKTFWNVTDGNNCDTNLIDTTTIAIGKKLLKDMFKSIFPKMNMYDTMLHMKQSTIKYSKPPIFHPKFNTTINFASSWLNEDETYETKQMVPAIKYVLAQWLLSLVVIFILLPIFLIYQLLKCMCCNKTNVKSNSERKKKNKTTTVTTKRNKTTAAGNTRKPTRAKSKGKKKKSNKKTD